ncbi:hypothetical protein PBI_GRAYSON_160 [Rhodococcus phage Grayson]|nr:hypothetical protein PBI_GRAYSON_160 [Rhodococcus phage Grayson]
MNKVYSKRSVTSDFTFFIVGKVKEDQTVYLGFLADEQSSHAVPLIIEYEVAAWVLEEEGPEEVLDHITELMLSNYLSDVFSGDINIPTKPSDKIDKLLYEVQDYYRFQESVKELIED